MLVGEVSQLSGVSVRMLRHYDSEGLVTPARRSGGYRDYDQADLERLMKVEALRSLGMGVAEVRDALEDPHLDVRAVLDRLHEETTERVRVEQSLLGHLDTLRNRHGTPPSTWDDVLMVTSLLRALRSPSTTDRHRAALDPAPAAVATAALVTSYLDEAVPDVAGALRWSLARGGAGVVDELVARAPVADGAGRLRIVEALEQIAGTRATEALRGFLDGEAPARSRAALALVRRGQDDTGLTKALVTVLVHMVADGDHDVEAAEALGRLCDRHPGEAASVVAALTGDSTHRPVPAKLRTVQALAEVRHPAATAALRAFTDDPDRTVAMTAQVITDRS